jgi:hypothetical protein
MNYFSSDIHLLLLYESIIFVEDIPLCAMLYTGQFTFCVPVYYCNTLAGIIFLPNTLTPASENHSCKKYKYGNIPLMNL